jgi:UDP-N-acetylmuramyl pentapeptide phosphotransferase/UDP-N-acetylglucosamine-1-phosphate transferase
LVGMLLIGGIAFTLGNDRFALEDRVRSALVAIAIGLVGYILYTIIAMMITQSGYVADLSDESRWIAPLISLVFAIGGLLVWNLKPGRIFGRKIRVK